MSNVAKFIRKNQDTCFADTIEKTAYNDFIISYNDKQCIYWKKAKKIKNLVNQPVLTRDEAHQAIKQHLGACKLLINDPSQHALLAQTCEELKSTVALWQLDSTISKDEKKTLNDILALKNQIRNSLFPQKNSPLKGIQTAQIQTNLSDQDKTNLRKTLKDMQRACLRKYFNERLKADKFQLDALKNRFQLHGASSFSESQFLQNQLDLWQKKLNEGKPIAIPKWYHCTKASDTMDTILKTDILFMHQGAYPGAFVSNKPEHLSYGSYCFMLSEHIEKTATKQKGRNTPLYPKQSSFYGEIHYNNTPKIAKSSSRINNQGDVSIWLAFQRGYHTFNSNTRRGTEGIPICRDARIQSGNLKYYQDTTVGFIYSSNEDPALQKIGQDRRVQVITYNEATALQTLINATFCCTLPADWKHNINYCT